jgi:hypothetical protein
LNLLRDAKPQAQRLVVPVKVAQQIATELFVVTPLENGEINQAGAKEELKIFAVTVEITF